MKTLVLITDAFPFGSVTETSFIAPEIKPLSKRFDRVIIAPRLKTTDKLDVDAFPKNVSISEALVISPNVVNKLRGLKGKIKAVLYDLKHSKGSVREIIGYSSFVGISYSNILKLVKEEKLDLHDTLFYTFWFDFTTAAFSLIPGSKVITRTHGHDLYEERYFISPWWRRKSLEKVTACFTVAKQAYRYLNEKYPRFSSKIHLSRLGTLDYNPSSRKALNHAQSENTLSLIGIARLSEEKGVLRQFPLLIDFARNHPQEKISYTHIGDGPLRGKIEELCAAAPANLDIVVKGALHNREVHEILGSSHFDAIILLSHSEGGCPVALCEAISYGIPAIVSDVGGIPEIFEDGGGVVLRDSEINPPAFEEAIRIVKQNSSELGRQAREIWEKEFEASLLRKKFADTVAGFLD